MTDEPTSDRTLDGGDRITRLPSLGPVGSRRRRAVFFAITGTLTVAAVWLFREVLAPFLLALILAYVLAAGRHGGRAHPSRATTSTAVGRVVVLYVGLLGAIAASVVFGVPRLIAEGQRLVREAPAAIHTIQDDWLPRVDRVLAQAQALYAGSAEAVDAIAVDEDARPRDAIVLSPSEGAEGSYELRLPPQGIEISPRGDRAYRVTISDREGSGRRDLRTLVNETLRRAFADTEAYLGTVLRSAQTLVGSVVGSVFSFFITLMLSAYILITKDDILGFFRNLARPSRRRSFDDLIARIDGGLTGVVRGQLLIALVNGVLSGIGFWIADLRYWPILTLVATVLSVIPIFGAIISSIPAVIVGLQDSVWTAIFVLVWIVMIHQIEANLLNPKIMGDAAKVHPVLVVFALLAGEHLFGILGALLAVPILSIVQSLFLHYREVALGVPKDPSLAAEWAEATLDRD